MSEKIDSIGSRELGEWLHAWAMMLEGEEAKLNMLGVGNWAPERLENMRRIARWLDEAKFEVRDPFPYVHLLERIRDSRTLSIERIRELSQHVLSGGSILDIFEELRQ